MIKKWIFVSFLNVFVAGVVGFLLRIFQYYEVRFPYGNFLHTHSHIAILGGLYQIYYVLIYLYFIPQNKKNLSSYSALFWITQITILGMLLSFPIQGYGLFSILFSVIHILCSYYFCFITFKNLSHENDLNSIFLRSALACMLISSFGIWGLGITMGTLGKNSVLYSICIQFYLHFQINGWFLLGSLALLLRLISIKSLRIPPKTARYFYILILGGILLTFGLPLSWYFHSIYIYIVYSLGILCNIAALVLYLKYIHPFIVKISKTNDYILSLLYGCFVISFVAKNVLQLFLLVPEMTQLSHEIKNLRIGFIHLEVLGMYTTLAVVLLLIQCQWINCRNNLIQIGTFFFLLFFFISESLLFIQGFYIYLDKGSIPYYSCVLSWISLLFPLSFGLYLMYLYQANLSLKSNSQIQ